MALVAGAAVVLLRRALIWQAVSSWRTRLDTGIDRLSLLSAFEARAVDTRGLKPNPSYADVLCQYVRDHRGAVTNLLALAWR
jgi:hypothetical protein